MGNEKFLRKVEVWLSVPLKRLVSVAWSRYGVVCDPKLKPSSVWQMVWLVMRTKLGLLVWKYPSPIPPWAMVMHKIRSESCGIEGCGM